MRPWQRRPLTTPHHTSAPGGPHKTHALDAQPASPHFCGTGVSHTHTHTHHVPSCRSAASASRPAPPLPDGRLTSTLHPSASLCFLFCVFASTPSQYCASPPLPPHTHTPRPPPPPATVRARATNNCRLITLFPSPSHRAHLGHLQSQASPPLPIRAPPLAHRPRSALRSAWRFVSSPPSPVVSSAAQQTPAPSCAPTLPGHTHTHTQTQRACLSTHAAPQSVHAGPARGGRSAGE